MPFKVGDIVGRKSYGVDVHFRITAIDEQTQLADLKGIDVRLYADSPLEDLVMIDDDTRGDKEKSEEEKTYNSLRELRQKREFGEYFELPGRVLHMDGDSTYLKKCMSIYKELNIPAFGIHLPEVEMPLRVEEWVTVTGP
jgi:spore coat assemly protein